MDLASLCGLLAAFTSITGLFFAIYTVRRMNKKLETFEGLAETAGNFLRYEEDEQGQPLVDARLGKMITLFSSSLAKSLKMSMLAGLSGQARLDSGLKGAMAKDIVNKQAPIIGLVGDILGIETQKYIGKHPDAMMQLAARFLPMLQKGNNSPGQQSSQGYM